MFVGTTLDDVAQELAIEDAFYNLVEEVAKIAKKCTKDDDEKSQAEELLEELKRRKEYIKK